MELRISGRESYERGLVLKQAQMYNRALDDFRDAGRDPEFAGKAYMQSALCFISMTRYEDALVSFRRALTAQALSANETVHVLYLLGKTLESLGRYAEALEAYNRVRQEEPHFRDVTSRIKRLCAKGCGPVSVWARQFHAEDLLTMWGHFRRRLPTIFLLGYRSLGQSAERKPSVGGRRASPVVSSNRTQVGSRSPMVKRQYVRLPIRGRSQFASRSQTVAGEGELKDLSPGGCRVTSSIVVPVGAELVCWIFPQNQGHPFSIEGATVRWRRAQEFGLAFTNVQPGAQREIARLCADAA